MIQIDSLTKSYPGRGGRHYVLREAQALLPEGKSVGIVGRNGAGKTTLLRILGNLDYPDSGRVITAKSISWPVGLRGGYHAKLTGRELARFVCTIYVDDPAQRADRVEWIKEFSELGKHFEKPAGTFSSGMHARLGFALSMAFDFDYYLIDEITAVGDRFFKEKSRQELDRKRAHACVIMVSHGLDSLKNYCEMGMLIEGGQLHVFPTIDEAIHEYEKL